MLLPPSETKRDGGSGAFRLGRLAFPELGDARAEVLAALAALDDDGARRALKLGPRQEGELVRNAEVVAGTAATMPAIERFTGVLFDALAVHELDAAARAWLDRHVLIASALLGLVRADDPVPAYRLSAGNVVPGLRLKTHWADRVGEILAAHDGLVLDLRSEAYRALGPASNAVLLRVEREDADGRRRALNHFNKAGKGLLVRRLAETRPAPADADDLVRWAPTAGLRIEHGAAGEAVLLA